jgi:antirestriction protein
MIVRELEDKRASLLMSEGTNAVLAVNGGARSALASLTGPATPIDSCAAAWTAMTGNLAQIIRRTTLMNSSIDTTSQNIEAREIPNDERLQILPRHFGRDMLTVECAVYAFMRKLATQYTGGCWTFFELSNGGFYMVPECETTFHICVHANGFEGSMSADAAGITACLFALSHLSFQIRGDSIADHYHQLRHFALEHAEASIILEAID